MSETLKIVLGYVVSFAYMGVVIALGELLHKLCHLSEDTTRKIEHILTSASWIIAYLFFGATYHLLITNFLGLVGLTVIMFSGKLKAVERSDEKKSYGLLYFGISTFIVATVAVVFMPEQFPLTGIPMFCLALGDGFAPIIAKAAGKHNAKVVGEKTVVGMATVFAISALVALVFNFIFHLGYSWLFIVSVGCLACVVESYSGRGTDNLFLELAVFGYVVLHYFGLVTVPLMIMLLIAPVTEIAALLTHSITPTAGRVSFVFLLTMVFFAGASVLSVIVICFFLSAVTSAITTRKFNARYENAKAKLPRGGYQIFANAVVAWVICLLYYVLKYEVLLFVCFAVLCEEFADSMASDVGRLSKNAPLDILRFKRTTAGISGGVSLLGIASALLGAMVAAALPFVAMKFDWKVWLIAAGVAFVGTFVDSIFGSGLQLLYRCPVCETLTERKTHCEVATEKVKGVRYVDNSMVNLLSGLVSAGIAFLLFYFLV